MLRQPWLVDALVPNVRVLPRRMRGVELIPRFRKHGAPDGLDLGTG